MEKFDYKLIRSKRRSISLEITAELEILVRAPYRMAKRDTDLFVFEHSDWIKRHIELQRQRNKNALPDVDADEIDRLRAMAKKLLPEKVGLYAALIGAEYKSIKITSAKKRLGSCSGDNRINFSYRLMMYDEDVIDYVVIHELCHTKEHNHSKRFYSLVEKFCPDYRNIEKKIKG